MLGRMNASAGPGVSDPRASRVASGRYAIFHDARECGEERFEIQHAGDQLVASIVHELRAPHPLPNRQAYRVALSTTWRPLGLDVQWSVGQRVLNASHLAQDGRWLVRIAYQDQTRDQEGDFPEGCEVEIASPLALRLILARRDFQFGGEHEFPVLRIGPPLMAVTPERMRLTCVERGERPAPWGIVAAKRYVATWPPREAAEGYGFWASEDDWVLEAFEGAEPGRPWMKLIEMKRPA
jgi:hypothetical protein